MCTALCIDCPCAVCKVCFIRWGLSLSRSPNRGWCFFFQHIRLQPLGCFDQWINGSCALVTIHLEWASAGSSPCLPLALLSPGLPSLPHELPWQLAATTSSRQTRSPWASQTHPLQTHSHIFVDGCWGHAPTRLLTLPPISSASPPSCIRLARLLSLSVWRFPASSCGLWTQEGADRLFGGKPAVHQSYSDVSAHPWSNMRTILLPPHRTQNTRNTTLCSSLSQCKSFFYWIEYEVHLEYKIKVLSCTTWNQNRWNNFFSVTLKLFTIQEQQALLNIPSSYCALVRQSILHCM